MDSLKDTKKGLRAPWYLVVGLIYLLLLAGCISGPQANTTIDTVMAKEQFSQNDIEKYNQQLLAVASRYYEPPEYTIKEGDLLLIKVFEAPELSTETTVSDNGMVTLALVGNLSVKGKTTSKAEELIEAAYKAKYLENPHISVLLKNQQGGKITVTGAVQKPGAYDFISQERILDVLALAGGLSEKAGHTVHIRRTSLETKSGDNLVIDLDQLINSGQEDLNINIRRGDYVFVPLAGVVYVDGAVQKPGIYQIKKNMTVQEAIVIAGGYHSTADPGRIKLARYDENGKREVIQLNTGDTKENLESNVTLKDRDIIFVESSPLASMIYGLQLRLGLVGFGYTPPAR